MSDSQEKPWSANPNAPNIPSSVYFWEKAAFAGNFVSPILYGTLQTPPLIQLFVLTLFIWLILGIVILMFFKCMAALFNPAHHRGESIKWGLVSYTVVMFLLETAGSALGFYVQSNCYIDNRKFPGGDMPLPGPIGYYWLDTSKEVAVLQNVVFALTNWLADGLLVSLLFGAPLVRPGV